MGFVLLNYTLPSSKKTTKMRYKEYKKIGRVGGRRGQASLEYFIVVSIALLILAPIIALSQQTSMDMEDFRNAVSLKQTIDNINNAANLVYAQGEPSSVIISVIVPQKVNRIECGDTYIDFRIMTIYGNNDYILSFPFNISCSLPLTYGKFKVKVYNKDGVVWIEKYGG